MADISLAFSLAASAINTAKILPGGIQLRVEVLPVDPHGSGTPNEVTKVAEAFARKGPTNGTTTSSMTNVIAFVGPLWSSNSLPAAREVSTPFRLPMIS